MMLAAHGRESDVDFFQFQLAEKLHKTVGEVEQMPRMEYVQWQAYLAAVDTFRQVQK